MAVLGEERGRCWERKVNGLLEEIMIGEERNTIAIRFLWSEADKLWVPTPRKTERRNSVLEGINYKRIWGSALGFILPKENML